MGERGNKHLPLILEWLLAFGLVLGASLFSRLFTRDALGVSTIWLANGLMLGLLLSVRVERWYWLLAACALGQFASSMIADGAERGVVTGALLNTLEVYVATLPLRNRVTSARALSEPGNFTRFLAAAALTPLLSGLVVAIYLTITGDLQAPMLYSWYGGHALGMAICAPVMLAMRGTELLPLFRREHRMEVLLGLGFNVIVTAIVFWQSRFPLLFLIFPPMLLAALRGGFAGTAMALIIVSAIAATLTGFGHGPLMLMAPEWSDSGIYLMLQVFIAVLLLTCFPVAVAISAWRRDQKSERRLRKLLGLLAEHSSDVIVLTDLDGQRVYVSPSVRAVLGWEPAEFLTGSFSDFVQPAGQEEFQRQLEQLRQVPGSRGTVTFPTRRKDGRKIWLEARLRHFRDADFPDYGEEGIEGRPLNRGPSGEEGFVVTLRNVTNRQHAEQALEEANRKLSSLVMKDGLTGLGNRRYFDQLLAEFWKHCEQHGLPMAVILIDIDFFKLYNDHYGHQEGDHCLREVSRSIAGSVRGARDSAARYGGEEFAVVLAEASEPDAARIAERIRHDVEQLAMPHTGSPFGHVTVSIGVTSVLPVAGLDPQSLVRSADVALYRSKAEGRNRTTVGEAPDAGSAAAGDAPGDAAAPDAPVGD